MLLSLVYLFVRRLLRVLVPGDEIAAYKRIAPERLRPWPFGTGQAVADWLARRK
jgi:hypothetical protein